MSTKKIKKSSKSRSTKMIKEQFPFRIDACESDCPFDFPIHTHGLRKLGWPELFTYQSVFGRDGGKMRMIVIYRYLAKPENASLLNSILKGDLVKISNTDVHPGDMDTFPVTYCMQQVSTAFKDVRSQCDHLSSEFPAGTKFKLVKIWAEGEDQDVKDDLGMAVPGKYLN